MTEIAALLQRLWDLRRAMLLALLVAVVAALVALFRLDADWPFLESRELQRGVAESQVLVDSERSALVNAETDVGALALRAQIFVQLLDTPDVRRLIAERARIDPSRLAYVTYSQVTGGVPARNPTLGDRGDEIADEMLGYRVEAVTQERLPVINMISQAPDAASAARLADAAAEVAVEYLSDLSLKEPPPARKDGKADENGLGRVRVEQLGRARGRTVGLGGGYARGALIGMLVFAVTAALILFVSALRDELRRRRTASA